MHWPASLQCLIKCPGIQEVATIEAGENAPKDTYHSAVKAIKSRIARSRKIPAASPAVEDDDEMGAEGSERHLQASYTSANSGMFGKYHKGMLRKFLLHVCTVPMVQHTVWSRQYHMHSLSTGDRLIGYRTVTDSC